MKYSAALTTDIVLFSINQEQLQVLLIQRALKPFEDMWALPGGFVLKNESLEQCAHRELAEETGVSEVYLEQLYTFGDPGRDPRGRVISTAYFSLVSFDEVTIQEGSDAASARWWPVDETGELAFDHQNILEHAAQRLVAKVKYSTIALNLLPKAFTLSEAQQVHEIILGRSLDVRNFRRALLQSSAIRATGQTRREGPYRPAALYQLKQPRSIEIFREANWPGGAL